MRWSARKDAAIAAPGAVGTAAVVTGSAAIVRHARKQNKSKLNVKRRSFPHYDTRLQLER